ncbi:hypothetical protein GDO81_022601, partial [Engystomops pustulosus]
PTKGVFTPEDSGHPQGISLSVSNCFLSRHGSFPVPSYKSVFRSYSQDFAPHSQAPALPLLNPAIFYSSRYSPVLPDPAPPPPAPLCPSLPSSQGGSSCGTPPACLPLQTPAVRTGGGSDRPFVGGICESASVSVPLSSPLCCAAAAIIAFLCCLSVPGLIIALIEKP